MASTFILKLMIYFPSLDPRTQQLVTSKLKVQLGTNGFQPSDGKNNMPKKTQKTTCQDMGARVYPNKKRHAKTWGPECTPVGGWMLTAAEVVAGVPQAGRRAGPAGCCPHSPSPPHSSPLTLLEEAAHLPSHVSHLPSHVSASSLKLFKRVTLREAGRFTQLIAFKIPLG